MKGFSQRLVSLRIEKPCIKIINIQYLVEKNSLLPPHLGLTEVSGKPIIDPPVNTVPLFNFPLFFKIHRFLLS